MMNKTFKWVVGSLLCLGLVTWFLGDKPIPSAMGSGLSYDEFDEIIKQPVAQISAVELADYLMKQEHHYNLIDLQGMDASYRIPSAEAMTVDEFLQKDVAVNETIILYSQHESTATQLYFLLLIRGYFKVQMLTGGVDQWMQQVLQPNLQGIPIELQSFRKGITDFFGGSFKQSDAPLKPKTINLEKKVKEHHGC